MNIYILHIFFRGRFSLVTTARTSADHRPPKIGDVPPREGKVGGPEAEAAAPTKANQLGRPRPKPKAAHRDPKHTEYKVEAEAEAPTKANQIGRPQPKQGGVLPRRP